MRNFLKTIKVIQSKPNSSCKRLNPYNPLSYATVVLTLTLALICFGLVGMWGELDLRKNPFKWN